VTIHDGADQPVAGATVTADYGGPNSGTVTGTTGADGTVTLQTAQKTNPNGTWCFTVTNVLAAGYTFNDAMGVLTACEQVPKFGETPPRSPDVAVFPNPARSAVTVRCDLISSTHLRLTVSDVAGHVVAVLADGEFRPGRNDLVFDAAALPAGIYMYQVYAEGETQTGRVIICR
jgi:hypothetical protein